MTEQLPQRQETYLSPELVQNLTARLNRLEGQVRGVNRMLNEQKPCEDIVVQLTAIKSALNQVTIKLLEGHIEMCISDYLEKGEADALDRFNSALAVVLKNS